MSGRDEEGERGGTPDSVKSCEMWRVLLDRVVSKQSSGEFPLQLCCPDVGGGRSGFQGHTRTLKLGCADAAGIPGEASRVPAVVKQ